MSHTYDSCILKAVLSIDLIHSVSTEPVDEHHASLAAEVIDPEHISWVI